MEAEFLKKAAALVRPGVRVSVKYRCINREEGNYPVRSMCRWAKVSKSGYYAWRNRPKSSTTRRREDLTAIIKVIFAESEQTYGYRRIHAELARNRTRVSRDTVRKIMAAEGLIACQPRKRAKTTTPAPDLPGRPDRLRKDFTATAPGNEMGGRHHVHPDLAGIRLPRGGHGLLQPEDRRAHESPVTCAPDSSPKPWPWPCETAHQPAVSLSFTQTEAPNTRRPNTRNS